MQFTLGQARKALSAYTHAYGVTDVTEAINSAVRDLADMSGWECLRKVLRFLTAGPEFSLPQGCAGLVRVCVNGTPSHLRGQDFSFLHSGPGDLSTPPCGYCAVEPRNVLDLGERPVYAEPYEPFRVIAFSDTDHLTGEPPVTIRGVTVDGRDVSFAVPLTAPAVYGADGNLVSGKTPDETEPVGPPLSAITSVTVDDCAAGYVTLYWVSDETERRHFMSTCHPAVKAPSFHRYRIDGTGDDEPLSVLAEVRIDPLPLVNDSDVLPFDTVKPIEWMIMASWKAKAGEIDVAQKYQALAANWLKAKEIAKDTVQASVVINSVYGGSMGELSDSAWNI